jgi:hypothetical protein
MQLALLMAVGLVMVFSISEQNHATANFCVLGILIHSGRDML